MLSDVVRRSSAASTTSAIIDDSCIVVLEIAHALLRPSRIEERSGSLAVGAAGEAAFFANLFRVTGDSAHRKAAERRINTAADWIHSAPRQPTLFQGFAGVAWAISHSYRCFDSPVADSVFQEVDSAILRFLNQPTSTQLKFELMEGLAGLAVYCLERLPSPKALESLRLLVHHIERLAESQPSGLLWRTPAGTLGFDSLRYPRGHVNLGIAHGVTGVIAALVQIAAHTGDTTPAKTLAVRAVDWLLDQRGTVAAPSRLPAYFDPDASSGRDSARLAWCYGDPGAAAVLLMAAKVLDRPQWEPIALELADSGIRLPEQQHLPVDASICHGAAGLGHIYNRLYQRTGIDAHRRASLDWFSLCLSMRRKSSFGVAGFAALLPDSNDANASWYWKAERGLLRGAAGIGLALLGLQSNQQPGWDAALGLS